MFVLVFTPSKTFPSGHCGLFVVNDWTQNGNEGITFRE